MTTVSWCLIESLLYVGEAKLTALVPEREELIATGKMGGIFRRRPYHYIY